MNGDTPSADAQPAKQTADDPKRGAPIRLAPNHDAAAYAKVYQRFRRIHIPGLLREEDARRVHAALAERTPWDLTVIHGQLVYDLKPDDQASLSEEKRLAVEKEVNEAASRQYEGRYRTRRISEHGEPYAGGIPELKALTKFLNSPDFLAFMRQVTGGAAIGLADAQATCYVPGDFLHPHIDVHSGRNRIAAYVLNLTPLWRVEWGGLLGFIGPDSHLTEAYTPAWNALNLLDVNELHYVSAVAQFAPEKRYSVTGWLRSKD